VKGAGKAKKVDQLMFSRDKLDFEVRRTEDRVGRFYLTRNSSNLATA
jgi:hypothetical protein